MSSSEEKASAEDLDVPLSRDVFLRQLLRELAGTLEEVVGLGEASGFISIVGQNVGDWLNDEYRKQWGATRLGPEQVSAVLVDLKRRIEGRFRVVSQDEESIVLVNEACPFGEKVQDRPSLCMMTSNVFGVIAAENLGYAKVILEETLAAGDRGCRVVIRLRQDPEQENEEGHEYFRS